MSWHVRTRYGKTHTDHCDALEVRARDEGGHMFGISDQLRIEVGDNGCRDEVCSVLCVSYNDRAIWSILHTLEGSIRPQGKFL